jgi:diadenosine tetraphosphate (Ap4A) HIT family hydrolase
MAAMRRISTIAIAAAMCVRALSAVECACDAANPDSLKVRQCSLCNEAEKQPGDTHIFFLKDISPRKPNRWLALPRAHGSAMHHLHDIHPEERTRLWTAAIEKAKTLWGDEWGVAYNGERVRTQCHTHVHIGKLLKGIETGNFIVISKPSQIPAPPGEGLWIHPAGNKIHVHLGEQTTETVLLR